MTSGNSESAIGQYVEKISHVNAYYGSTDYILTGGLELNGTGSNDVGYGTAYNDTIWGWGGDDTLYGNAGNDTLIGSDGNDTLYGGAGNDYLEGGYEDDTLEGGDGNDLFYFGEGADTVKGDAGSDTFALSYEFDTLADAILDFNMSQGDKIDISQLFSNYDIYVHNITDFLQITAIGSDSILKVDYDGAGGDFTYEHFLTLSGITGLTASSLIGSGALILGTSNVAPTAYNDDFETTKNQSFNGNVLDDNGYGADKDLNFNTLTVIADTITTSNGGTVALLTDGSFTYTPSYNYEGVDSFEYIVSDGELTGTATAYINVVNGNNEPTAQDDSFSVNHGTSGTNVTGNLLANNGSGVDSDSDGGTLSVVESLITTTQGRTVTISPNGNFVYHAGIGHIGLDTFTYTLSDGQGGTDTATVSINISAPVGATTGTDSADTYNGTTGNDKYFGASGNDTISGNNGNDELHGGAGNDTVSGGSGTDTLTGGSGTDTLNGDAGNDTLYGENDADTLNGGANDDYLYGGDGNDTLHGDAGIDRLYGGQGADYLSGGADQDFYYFDAAGTAEGDVIENNGAGTENDTLYFINLTNTNFTYKIAANGLDLIIVSAWGTLTVKNQFASDISDRIGSLYYGTSSSPNQQTYLNTLTFTGDNSSETITMPTMMAANSKIYGMGGDDILTGGANTDYLYGGDDNDILYGAGGQDELHGGAGTDTIYGDAGNDIIYGEDEADILYGGANNDRLYGGAGNDTIYGDAGIDSIYAGTGADYLSGGADQDFYYFDAAGTAEGDIIENNGTAAENDTLYFINLTNTNFTYKIASNGLDLIIVSEWGTLTVKNQFASDSSDRIGTLNYGMGSSPNQVVSLTAGLSFSGEATDDVMYMPTYGAGANSKLYGLGGDDILTGGANTDYLYGGDDNDILYGAGGQDELHGGNGNDYLNGGANNDVVYGDANNDTLLATDGVDTLYGGSDSDIFLFNAINTNSDTIADFSLAQGDKIDVSDILQGYDPLTHAITDFVQITTSNSHSILKVDVDGGGNNFVQIATILNVTGITDEAALVTSGHLVVT